jgi:hypothetical protein
MGLKTLMVRRICRKSCSEPVHSGVTDYVCCFKKMFCCFQVTDLKRIFQFCVQALGELSKVVPPYSDEVLALLKHLLSIAEGVLSWGFISAYHILYGLLYPCYLLLMCWLRWWNVVLGELSLCLGPCKCYFASASIYHTTGLSLLSREVHFKLHSTCIVTCVDIQFLSYF